MNQKIRKLELNIQPIVILFAMTVLAPLSGNAEDSFYSIQGVSASTEDSDLWTDSNLIQGPAVGFNAVEPHEKLIGGESGNWVTDAPCGFPSDYIDCAGKPVIRLDMGTDVALAEISVWGYDSGNANGVSEIALRFATEAEGETGFEQSITYNPTFNLSNDDTNLRQSHLFGREVTARFVELEILDNFFLDPGDGSTGGKAGGDRVGLGEIAFQSNLTFVTPAVLGDFNRNGTLDVDDIDLLSAELVAFRNAPRFDLNGDGRIRIDDLRFWVTEPAIMGTWFGDANLDGEFNLPDIVSVLSSGLYNTGRSASWAQGDWNADLVFDIEDLLVASNDGGYLAGLRGSEEQGTSQLPTDILDLFDEIPANPVTLPALDIVTFSIGEIKGVLLSWDTTNLNVQLQNASSLQGKWKDVTATSIPDNNGKTRVALTDLSAVEFFRLTEVAP